MLGRLGAAGDAEVEALLCRAAGVARRHIARQEGIDGADRRAGLARLQRHAIQAPVTLVADRAPGYRWSTSRQSAQGRGFFGALQLIRFDVPGIGGQDSRVRIGPSPAWLEAQLRSVGARPISARSPSVRGWRVAWTPDLGGLVAIDDEVRALVEHATRVFRSLGARVEEACPDLSDVPEIVRLSRGFLMVARHADKLPEHRAILQAGLVENTEQGLALSSREVAQGELLRTRQWHRVREFLETREVWITPTMAVPAFPVEHPHIVEIDGTPVGKAMQRSHLTYAFSVMGLPAISIPCGFTTGGLPVGLQIVGKRRAEATVLRAAAAFEAAQPWADRIPPVISR